MRYAARVLVFGSPLAAAALVACGSTSSPPESAADAGGGLESGALESGATDAGDASDGASCTLPGVLGSEACQQCMSTRCCGQLAACESDAVCKPLLRCTIECLPKPDAGGCRTACEANSPGSNGPFRALELCSAASSSTTCGELCTTQ